MTERIADHRIGALLFGITCTVFLLSPVVTLSDSNYSMLLSESIIHNHSTHLNAYRFPAPIREDARCVSPLSPLKLGSLTYQLDRINGNVVYCYPHGTSILSLPFVALMNWFGISSSTPDGQCNPAGEGSIQRLLASILMAAFTLVVFRTALLMLGVLPSLFIAIGTAFGTQVWSTASRAMWGHTWLIFLGGIAAHSLLRRELGQKTSPIFLATMISWMYFARPTAAIPIACITVYMLAFWRRDFVLYAATGGAWFAAFVAYSWFAFGKLIPDYYLDSRIDFAGLHRALLPLLISPSRGLFVYVPILIFVFYLVVRYWTALPARRLAILMLSIVVVEILMVACWPIWWGGFSYGPRLLADAIPWLALLAILGFAARADSNGAVRLGRLELTVALALLAVSIAINSRGALSSSTNNWNLEVDIDQHPERALDWSYPQFAAGLIPEPKE